MKATLTIGRMASANRALNNKIIIEVKDEKYNTVAECKIDAEKFALAITGLAFQECEIELK